MCTVSSRAVNSADPVRWNIRMGITTRLTVEPAVLIVWAAQ